MVAYNGDHYRQISPYTQISCTSPIPNTLRSSEEILVELLLLCPQLLQLLVRKDSVWNEQTLKDKRSYVLHPVVWQLVKGFPPLLAAASDDT